MDKSKVKLFIGISCLLIGCTLISVPLYHEYQYQQEVRALEEALLLLSSEEFVLASEIEQDQPLGWSLEDQQKSSQQEAEQNKQQDEIDWSAAVIELEIPSIELRQYVLPETTEENLSVALTQIKEGQVPGEGNFTIAGHRGYRNQRHFSNLPSVEPGEELFLHIDDTMYVYQVTATEVIAATQVEILEDDPLKKEITLITCTRDGKQRIAVKGEFVRTMEST